MDRRKTRRKDTTGKRNGIWGRNSGGFFVDIYVQYIYNTRIRLRNRKQ